MLKEENKVKKYTIPPEGSLGLLAAGDKGLRAWRKVRDAAKKDKKGKKLMEDE